jgi:hypothetical protein
MIPALPGCSLGLFAAELSQDGLTVISISIVPGGRGNNGHATTHEVGHERRKAIKLAL